MCLGQLASRLSCALCGAATRAFDPFTVVSLPVPNAAAVSGPAAGAAAVAANANLPVVRGLFFPLATQPLTAPHQGGEGAEAVVVVERGAVPFAAALGAQPTVAALRHWLAVRHRLLPGWLPAPARDDGPHGSNGAMRGGPGARLLRTQSSVDTERAIVASLADHPHPERSPPLADNGAAAAGVGGSRTAGLASGLAAGAAAAAAAAAAFELKGLRCDGADGQWADLSAVDAAALARGRLAVCVVDPATGKHQQHHTRSTTNKNNKEQKTRTTNKKPTSPPPLPLPPHTH